MAAAVVPHLACVTQGTSKVLSAFQSMSGVLNLWCVHCEQTETDHFPRPPVEIEVFFVKATWLRADKGTSPVLERLWLEKTTQKKTNQAKLSTLFPHAHTEESGIHPSDCGHHAFGRWQRLLPTFCLQNKEQRTRERSK